MLSELVGSTPPSDARPVSLAVREFLRERKSAPGSYGLCIAVSGGADSLALAVAAGDIAGREQIPYTACIVDHQMRPGSGQEADQVRTYLESLGLRNVRVLRSEEQGSSTRPASPEGSARALRYRLLEEAALNFAGRLGLDRVDILLGHTMDDQAETVLMRLGRGSGALALSAMAPVVSVVPVGPRALHRARPLLGVRRADTERFCRALGLTYLDDPTNAPDGPWRTKSGAPLPRAAIRARVLPSLREALGQDPVPALARSAQLLREDSDALEDWGERTLQEALTETAQGPGLLVSVLRGQPQAIVGRVLKSWAELCGADPLSQTQVGDLSALLENPRNAAGDPRHVHLPGGLVAGRVAGELRADASAAPPSV